MYSVVSSLAIRSVCVAVLATSLACAPALERIESVDAARDAIESAVNEADLGALQRALRDAERTLIADLGPRSPGVIDSLENWTVDAFLRLGGSGLEEHPILASSFERLVQLRDQSESVTLERRFDQRILLSSYHYLVHRYVRAARVSEEAYALLSTASVSDSLLAAARYDLGLTYMQTGRFAEAVDLLDQAIAISQPDDPLGWLIHAQRLVGLGEAARRAGRYDAAAQHTQSAIEILETRWDEYMTSYVVSPGTPDPVEVYAKAVYNAGGMAYDRGCYDESSRRVHQVLDLIDGRSDLQDLRALCVLSLADLALLQGREHQAEALVDSVLVLAETAFPSGSPGAAPLLQFAGEAAQRADQNSAALAHFDRAVEILEAAGAAGITSLPTLLSRRAAFLESIGRLQESRSDLEQAIAIVSDEEIATSANLAMLEAQLGRVLLALGDSARGRVLLEKALRELESTEVHRAARAEARVSLARQLWSEGSTHEAIRLLELALDDRSDLRWSASVDPFSRSLVAASSHDEVGTLARWYAAQGRLRDAIVLLEDHRARGLREQSLLRARVNRPDDDQTNELRRSVDVAESELSILRREHDAIVRDESLERRSRVEALVDLEARVRAQREALRSSREALWRALRLGGRTTVDGADAAAVVDALDDALGADEAILFYHVDGLGADLYVLRGGAQPIQHHALTSYDEGLGSTRPCDADLLEQLVEDGAFGAESPSVEAGSARRTLREAILPEAVLSTVQDCRIARLVLDAPLHGVPFDVLPSSEGELLIEQKLLFVRAPSLASVVDREARGEPENWSGRLTLIAHSHSNPRPGVAPVTPDEAATRGLAPSPLPFAVTEARAIASQWHLGERTLLIDETAREDAVRAAARTSAILHFATHGLVERVGESVRACLLLEPQDDPRADRDGQLELSEIELLDLDASLVVLSACESAVGASIPGEGEIALHRGFLTAGARRVVASLWKVDDRATAELMQSFYGALQKNLVSEDPRAIANALRVAKQAVRSRAEFADPVHWGGFVVMGGP